MRKIKECHHIMHASCLERWILVQSKCPLCKIELEVFKQINIKKLKPNQKLVFLCKYEGEDIFQIEEQISSADLQTTSIATINIFPEADQPAVQDLDQTTVSSRRSVTSRRARRDRDFIKRIKRKKKMRRRPQEVEVVAEKSNIV